MPQTQARKGTFQIYLLQKMFKNQSLAIYLKQSWFLADSKVLQALFNLVWNQFIDSGYKHILLVKPCCKMYYIFMFTWSYMNRKICKQSQNIKNIVNNTNCCAVNIKRIKTYHQTLKHQILLLS